MAYQCALCGSDDAQPESLPVDWEEYLRDERDLSPPGIQWQVPLCGEHAAEYDHLRKSYLDRGMMDDETAQKVEGDADDLLDRLDLDRLVDEQ
ncbi:hypothetical protein [Haloarchaeobius iranensis]|uniref:hypothetical protein n=1 Tax=Haloarchaeobius iranensis TaxID=996166 RepID=UPI00362D3455